MSNSPKVMPVPTREEIEDFVANNFSRSLDSRKHDISNKLNSWVDSYEHCLEPPKEVKPEPEQTNPDTGSISMSGHMPGILLEIGNVKIITDDNGKLTHFSIK